MKKPKNNQSGFGAAKLILIVVVVALLVGLGYMFYKNQKKVTPVAITTKTNTTPVTSPTKTEQKYLVVTEWGIKVPVTDPISDAYYMVSKSSQDASGQPNTVWLGLRSLDSGCPAAAASTGGTALAGILRVTPTETEPVSGASYKHLYPDGTTVGSYYYAYQSQTKNKSCASANSLQTINTAFTAASKNIVAN
jgi:hypothetical protein